MLEGDQERIALLQEWFGYCLTPETSQQKFLLLEGLGANGKSVVAHVLAGILGAENVSSVPLESFAARFSLAPTHGKLLNVCAEATALPPLTEGIVKQFVAGDSMTADRKFISPLTFRPTARIMITTNKRPAVADDSEGFWRRMMILPFRVTIPVERQDPTLPEKLMLEAPGIFNWAIGGLRRLRTQGHFTMPALSLAASAEAKLEDNPIRAFAAEHLTEGGDVVAADAYAAYRSHCEQAGERPVSAGAFGKGLKRVFPSVEKVRERRDGKLVWTYRGISLADKQQQQVA